MNDNDQQGLSTSAVQHASSAIAHQYFAEYRYSWQAYREALAVLVAQMGRPPQLIVDVGTGTGATTVEMRQSCPRCTLIAIDVSRDMLNAGRESAVWDYALVARAEELPLKGATADVVLCSFAFHLLDKELAMREFARVAKHGGLLGLIVYDRTDHREQIFMKYFPEYAAGELSRHPTLETAKTLGKAHGFSLVDRGRFEYVIRFESVEALVDLVSSRPFYGLRLMADDEFEVCFDQFSRRVRRQFPVGPVVSKSAIAIWLFRRTQ